MLRCFYNVRPRIRFDVRNSTSFSSGPFIGRIGLLLYKHRLILRQVTVQGFELLHLFTRISLFMSITVVGVACVFSSGFRTDVLTRQPRMVIVAVVDRKNMSRIVYQGARMYSLFFFPLHSRSNTSTVPLLAFLTFGTRLVRFIFSSSYISISFQSYFTMVGRLPS